MVQSGLEGVSAPFVDLSAPAFGHHLGLNLWTAFFVTRAALPGMIERGYGRIVMVSSVTGPVVTNPERRLRRGLGSDGRSHAVGGDRDG
jgi:3-oxoacyl-[acyl-carrier protein] reductase